MLSICIHLINNTVRTLGKVKCWCALQATLDEQRQAMVHQVMLDKLQQRLAAFAHSVPAAAWKGAEQAADVTALATSGDTQALQLQMLAESTESDADAKLSVCTCLLYTSPSPRDRQKSRMPSSA